MRRGVEFEAAAKHAVVAANFPQGGDALPRPDEAADHPIQRGRLSEAFAARGLPRDVNEAVTQGDPALLPFRQVFQRIAADAQLNDVEGHAAYITALAISNRP